MQNNSFSAENFDNTTKSEKFTTLTFQDLTFIVQNQNQKLANKTSIYKVISSWIRHDELNRKNEIRKLLLLIDLHKMPSDFLQDVVATDLLVKDDNECLKTVTSAITKQFQEMRQKERRSKLISVGGEANHCQVMEIFNFYFLYIYIWKSAKSVYPDLPSPSFFSKSLELNGYIYNISGSSGLHRFIDSSFYFSSLAVDIIKSLKWHWIKTSDRKNLKKVYRMNVNDSEMKWEKVSSMNKGRCMMGAAVFKDCLVVAGGVNTDGEFSTKEETYTPKWNKWQQISKLNQERIANELVSCVGCLFALGGYNGKQPLFSMEKLSDFDGEWEAEESINEPSAWFAAVNCEGEIYAIGGCRENSGEKDIALKSVEKYSTVTKKWSFVASIKTERIYHAACVWRGKIFMVGGLNAHKDPVETIECYDAMVKKWTLVGETESELAFHSLIVV